MTAGSATLQTVASNPWLPALLVALAAAAAFAGAVTWLVLRLTRGVAEAGTGFFAALDRHDAAGARTRLSDAFLARTPPAALDAWLAQAGLPRGGRAQWLQRNRRGRRGFLSGHVQPPQGRAVPMQVALVQYRGEWRIHALHRPAGLLDTFLVRHRLPSPGVSP